MAGLTVDWVQLEVIKTNAKKLFETAQAEIDKANLGFRSAREMSDDELLAIKERNCTSKATGAPRPILRYKYLEAVSPRNNATGLTTIKFRSENRIFLSTAAFTRAGWILLDEYNGYLQRLASDMEACVQPTVESTIEVKPQHGPKLQQRIGTGSADEDRSRFFLDLSLKVADARNALEQAKVNPALNYQVRFLGVMPQHPAAIREAERKAERERAILEVQHCEEKLRVLEDELSRVKSQQAVENHANEKPHIPKTKKKIASGFEPEVKAYIAACWEFRTESPTGEQLKRQSGLAPQRWTDLKKNTGFLMQLSTALTKKKKSAKKSETQEFWDGCLDVAGELVTKATSQMYQQRKKRYRDTEGYSNPDAE